MIDDTRFPRTATYLAGLPRGLNSYPGCLAKGSILRTALHGRGWNPEYTFLPPDLREMLRQPPLPIAWISEVHSVAGHHVVADVEGMTNEEVLAWQYTSFSRLAESAMYRAIAKVASPRFALRSASLSWNLLHKGLPLTSSIRDDASGSRHTAELRVRHPAGLWVELVHRCSAEGFRVVLESAGGRDVRVRVEECDTLGARYLATWED